MTTLDARICDGTFAWVARDRGESAASATTRAWFLARTHRHRREQEQEQQQQQQQQGRPSSTACALARCAAAAAHLGCVYEADAATKCVTEGSTDAGVGA